MNVWEIAILRILDSRGGKADTKEIYTAIESGTFIKLDEKHLWSTEYGGPPAYQNQVRSHFSNLTQAGDLERVSWGIYSLTAKGRKRIER
jgi:hypothetical protein